MAFAIFYEPGDFVAIAKQLRRPDLSMADKIVAAQVWDSGFRYYESCPFASIEKSEGDNMIHELVISGPTKLEMQTLLRSIGATFGGEAGDPEAEYMNAIADDMSVSAVEPWPVV